MNQGDDLTAMVISRGAVIEHYCKSERICLQTLSSDLAAGTLCPQQIKEVSASTYANKIAILLPEKVE